MRDRLQKRFEEGLAAIKESLTKKGGQRSYDKVLERVGKLRNRCTSVARFYEVAVAQSGDRPSDISWSIQNEEGLRARFRGGYFIRTSRKDFDEVGLWSLLHDPHSCGSEFSVPQKRSGPASHVSPHRSSS